MSRFSNRQLSIALRAVLGVGALFFIGFLLLLNDARVNSAREYPELAHLAWPVYIGVLIGFAGVFCGILNAWRWTALAGRGSVHSPEALTALRWITRCGLAVWVWFTAGLPAWLVASGGMDPPFITFWLAMTVPTLFATLLSALLARVLAAGR